MMEDFGPKLLYESTKTQRSEMLNERIDGNYGSDWNNLYKNSWNDVIAHEFYSNDLVSSWDSKSIEFTDVQKCVLKRLLLRQLTFQKTQTLKQEKL